MLSLRAPGRSRTPWTGRRGAGREQTHNGPGARGPGDCWVSTLTPPAARAHVTSGVRGGRCSLGPKGSVWLLRTEKVFTAINDSYATDTMVRAWDWDVDPGKRVVGVTASKHGVTGLLELANFHFISWTFQFKSMYVYLMRL